MHQMNLSSKYVNDATTFGLWCVWENMPPIAISKLKEYYKWNWTENIWNVVFYYSDDGFQWNEMFFLDVDRKTIDKFNFSAIVLINMCSMPL